jgi:proteasome assembly chaperone 2
MEFLKSLPSSSGLLPTSEAITDLWKDIRGTGLSPLLHTQCHMKSIPFLSFVLYCAEGNNVPEAMKMASLVVQYLEMEKFLDTEEKYFVFPPSWKQLFGRAPDISLYL